MVKNIDSYYKSEKEKGIIAIEIRFNELSPHLYEGPFKEASFHNSNRKEYVYKNILFKNGTAYVTKNPNDNILNHKRSILKVGHIVRRNGPEDYRDRKAIHSVIFSRENIHDGNSPYFDCVPRDKRIGPSLGEANYQEGEYICHEELQRAHLDGPREAYVTRLIIELTEIAFKKEKCIK